MENQNYGCLVCRIVNPLQIIYYKSQGLKELDTYVSKNKNGDYRLVFVFSREESQDLFIKFRNHETVIGDNVLDLTKL